MASAMADPTLRDILQKHLDAMGGLNNWNRVESIQLNGIIERNGQMVHIVIVKKRPSQIRATVTVPIPDKEDAYFQIIRAHDGKTAWTATRLAGAPEMKKEELPAEAAAELLGDAGVLPPLIKLWRAGGILQLSEPQKIDGQDHYVIQAKPKDGPGEFTFYLSQSDHLVTQYTSHHPDQGATLTKLSGYRLEQEVRIPTLNIIDDKQTGRSVMTTDSIRIGVGIYKEYFQAGEGSHTAKR